MDIRLLSLTEFHSVYFFRFITLAFLLVMGGAVLFNVGETPLADTLLMAACVFVLSWRFAIEWLRVTKSRPAFIHNDELVISSSDSHRQIPLTTIRSIKSRHSIFMVRRYRSWSEHLAFLEFTLNNGERFYTLSESAVLEFPAGKKALNDLQAAILAAKVKKIQPTAVT